MEFYTRITEEGQSIWDIAIQEYGDVMMAWIVLEDNKILLTDLNVNMVPGTALQIRKVPVVIDRELMNYFRDNEIYINCKN